MRMPVPLQDSDEPGYETGIFLCFIQHIQFKITHGQAYISDFQGTYKLQSRSPHLTYLIYYSIVIQEELELC